MNLPSYICIIIISIILLFYIGGIFITVYKRPIFQLIKSIVIAICFGVAWYFIVPMFTSNVLIVYGGLALATLALLYMAFFSENIRFEIEGSQLRYYQKGKLRNTFELKDCGYSYRVKHSSSTDSIDLCLQPADGSDALDIDCASLGDSRFYKMIEHIERYAHKDETIITATKKAAK